MAKELTMSRPTYIQIEKGQRELTLSEVKKLSALFNLSFEQFVSGRLPKSPQVCLKSASENKTNPLKIEVSQSSLIRFKEILLYVLGKIGAQPHFGQTALFKILYFIDFEYYEAFKRKIIGATYIKNHYGPTPVEFKVIIQEMEKAREVETVRSNYFQYQQTKYLPLRKPDLSILSGRDQVFIDKILYCLGDKNARELSELSHQDAPWKLTPEGQLIDYRLVFKRKKTF
jgi:transcriptional regulator with XRE-family HTH domain